MKNPSTSHWRISEVAQSCNATFSGTDGPFPNHFTTDSREVQQGSCFIALPGNRTDGHCFVKQALANGARLIIGQMNRCPVDIFQTLPCGTALILSREDSLKTLLQIARCYLQRVAPQEIVAITGSVGKTTTREITSTILKDRNLVHSAQKSFNTDVGCALTVLSMPEDTEILVLEMGCNHPGEIARMVEWFPPTRAIITEVGPSHLEGLSNIEGVLKAKMEIAESQDLISLIYNCDNPYLSKAMTPNNSTQFSRIAVGYSQKADLRILGNSPISATVHHEPCFRMILKQGEREVSLDYKLFGFHHGRNIALALTAALQIQREELQAMTINIKSPKGRGSIIPLNDGGQIVDDSYNANPISLSAALEAFHSLPEGPEGWIVLGGMKELGEQTAMEHQKIIEKTAPFRHCLFVGEEWAGTCGRNQRSRVWKVSSAAEAINVLKQNRNRGEAVLVKGSRSYHLEDVVNWLVRFDDQ